VFPSFVVAEMPRGCRLLIAAIFAAAMSSIAAELNALAPPASSTVRRWLRPAAKARDAARSRLAPPVGRLRLPGGDVLGRARLA